MPDLLLFSVSDRADDDREGFNAWNEAVWAWSEAEALQWAADNYAGECPSGQDSGIKIVSAVQQNAVLKPEQAGIHQERRMEALRQVGWKEEGERSCDQCGMYALGHPEFRVCDECGLCPECRDDCEECK